MKVIENNNSFGEMVLDYRKKRGLSQKRLGKQMGIPAPMVTHFERPDSIFLLSTVEKHGAKLGIEFFITDGNNMVPAKEYREIIKSEIKKQGFKRCEIARKSYIDCGTLFHQLKHDRKSIKLDILLSLLKNLNLKLIARSSDED